MIRCIESNKATENSPITESASGKASDLRGIWAFIEVVNEFWVEICVECVVPRETGILGVLARGLEMNDRG